MERKIHLVTVKGNVQKAEGNKSATTRQEPLKINLVCFLIKAEVWIKKNTNRKLLSENHLIFKKSSSLT